MSGWRRRATPNGLEWRRFSPKAKKVGDFFNLKHNGVVLPGIGVRVCGV